MTVLVTRLSHVLMRLRILYILKISPVFLNPRVTCILGLTDHILSAAIWIGFIHRKPGDHALQATIVHPLVTRTTI